MGKLTLLAAGSLFVVTVVLHALTQSPATAQKATSQQDSAWVEEVEDVFIPSEDCKQCHDRHYEEWKGVREQTPDLKTFGRVDAALLHGTSLESPVFKTVLGLWLQTDPTAEERTRCLSCHVPPVTVYPQYTSKYIDQVLTGKVQVEGIGCASCHLIKEVAKIEAPPPTFKIQPGKVLYGPFDNPEENLVHPSSQAEIYRGANYCTSCHFDKVKDVTRRDLPGEILQGTICQDCHMEQSTGSSTSRRGALTRAIGRHWFRGVVVSGTLLKNRNLQAEWMPRLDLEVQTSPSAVEGMVLVRVGSLPHSFPDGDPVLKQFFITVTLKDEEGNILVRDRQHFGRSYEEVMRGPIPDPLVKGGTTRRIPFKLNLDGKGTPKLLEALLTYSLIPEPSPKLKERYFATLGSDKEREAADKLINEYTQPRVLTFRTKSL
ncbi:MAG: multiheme c-type cytochrome [Nitrospirales bacterium]